MTRGELYLVKKAGSSDPKRQRVFVVVSRQAVIESQFSSVICAPVYSRHDGLSTKVRVGIDEGLKGESSVHCDELVSLAKASLTRYVGRLGEQKSRELDAAIAIAVDVEER